MRVILYTGKGGTGKTTISAATAVRAAALGYSTCVMSTDIAHSLGDCFDVPLSGTPTEVAPNLYAQEIDVYHEMGVHWETIRSWLAGLMQWQGVDAVVAEEMATLPGMEEMVGLLHITSHAESGNYDVLIIDAAPTGETLRLLSFPEMARWYMHRIFPIEKLAAAALRPLARPFLKVPLIPDQQIFDSVQYLYQQLDKMFHILTDPQLSSMRIVVNPEKIVIKEAQRTYTYMNLYGYSTDLIVCNRLIPESVSDPFLSSVRARQQRYYKLIEEGFSPVPILDVPLFQQEMVGVETLSYMAAVVFGQEDPVKVFYTGPRSKISKVNGHWVMMVPLPFTTKGDVSVLRASGNEVVVQVGHHRRTIMLPTHLAGLEILEAKLDDSLLALRFAARERAGAHR